MLHSYQDTVAVFFVHNFGTGLRTLSLPFIGYWGAVVLVGGMGGQGSDRGIELTAQLGIVPRLRLPGGVPPLPHIPSE